MLPLLPNNEEQPSGPSGQMSWSGLWFTRPKRLHTGPLGGHRSWSPLWMGGLSAPSPNNCLLYLRRKNVKK